MAVSLEEYMIHGALELTGIFLLASVLWKLKDACLAIPTFRPWPRKFSRPPSAEGRVDRSKRRRPGWPSRLVETLDTDQARSSRSMRSRYLPRKPAYGTTRPARGWRGHRSEADKPIAGADLHAADNERGSCAGGARSFSQTSLYQNVDLPSSSRRSSTRSSDTRRGRSAVRGQRLTGSQ